MVLRSMKFFSIILAVLMVLTLASGCSKSEPEESDTPQTDITDSEKVAESEEAESESIYPIDTDVTLTYWLQQDTTIASMVSDYHELPFYQELEKRTGVKIEYITAAGSNWKDELNLMIASNDLPDLIQVSWLSRPGGPEKYIADKTIIKLNDVFAKYAPNLTSYLKANPEIDKMIKTDNGNYYVFPCIRGDETLLVSTGLMLRKDWLDELGLQVPTTMEEWYEVLTAFKEKKNAEIPFSAELWRLTLAFPGAFGVHRDFYVDNGKVLYGPMEPGFKDYLGTLKKWFDEGLLDNNFMTLDSKLYDSNILSGKSGATHGAGGSGLGRFLDNMKETNPEFDLVAAPYPTMKKGEKPEFAEISSPYADSLSVAITTDCKNVEIAARFLDYAYGEEGHMLNNFGIEGVSYKMEDGYPKYTDNVMNDPELPVSKAMRKYMRGVSGGPFIQDKRVIEQYYNKPQQQDALKAWTYHNGLKHRLPPITPTLEESSEVAAIMADVKTYVKEMQLKFIMGVEDLNGFDTYVEQMKSMGIDRVVEIYQSAYDRYEQ